MQHIVFRLSGIAAALFMVSAAQAQQPLKIGVILPYSGQFADTAAQIDNGIKLYMKQHGDTVAGRKIEIIRKDTGGIAPDVAKRLAQELVVRDGVEILAGFALTPNALAASDMSEQAKKFMVIMNAATSIITTKSQYSVRASMTMPQVDRTLGAGPTRAASARSIRMVSDFGPGHDAEGASRALQGGGRRDRRRGADAGRQSGLLRLRAASQGPQSGIDLHLRTRRRAAGGARQGIRGARHRPGQDQDFRHRRE